MRRELLLGCGRAREKAVYESPWAHWTNLTTLDMNPACEPAVVHDLRVFPWPFDDNTFDEVHAYHVLEHLGRQGDVDAFFRDFAEIYRILKPNGRLFGACPLWDNLWAWSDPGHTRLISSGTLVFLSQEEYHRQVGRTQMSDYRSLWKGDFDVEVTLSDAETIFKLRALKPARTF